MFPFIDIHTHHFKVRDQHDSEEFIEVYNASLNEKIAFHTLKSIGIHPWNIDVEKDQLKALELSIENEKSIIALGECGLDYSIETDKKIQILYFRQQILIADKYKLPLIIHCVKAFDDLILLKKENRSTIPWIIHGFNKSPELATDLIKKGFYISLSKVLFQNKAARILDAIPLNRLFFETDDDPEMDIVTLYQKASEISRIDQNEIKKQLFLNYNSIFNEYRG